MTIGLIEGNDTKLLYDDKTAMICVIDYKKDLNVYNAV